MSIIDISEIEKYGEKHGVENFSPKVTKILEKNKLYIDNVLNSKEKPSPEFMFAMLKEKDPFMVGFYERVYKKRKEKSALAEVTFMEFISKKYCQIGISKSYDAKSKREDGEYYSREEYLNNEGKVIKCDIERTGGDLYEYCKKNNIYDLEFKGWGFNIR